MYAVVGCGECQALWIVEGKPERSQCPRCSKTRPFSSRRAFVTTDDKAHAREMRSRLLAAEAGHEETYERAGTVAELAEQAASAGVDDDSYLEGMGLDPAAIEASVDHGGTDSRSRTEIVRDAITTLENAPDEQPTRETIREYANEYGIPVDYTERMLEKMRQQGEVCANDGVYRLLSTDGQK